MNKNEYKVDFRIDQIRVLLDKLSDMRRARVKDLPLSYAKTGYKSSNDLPSPADLAPYVDEMISGADEHAWFYTECEPIAAEEGKTPFLHFASGYEGSWDAQRPQCLVYLNGEMVQAFDTNHIDLRLEYGKAYKIHIYYYSGPLPSRSNVSLWLEMRDDRIDTLYYDLLVPYESAKLLPEESDDYLTIVRHLELALRLLDLRVPFSPAFFESVKEAQAYMATEFYGKACGKSDITLSCIGHTHIDVAWLWSVRQTVEKAQRSFSTVLKLMEEYPEYRFMSSQPQLYAFVKREAPELYEQMKARIAEGRWEPEGAMWLEADCNLTSGESLVRQILYGKAFMKKEFGVDSTCVWLPDVFGYSAAMPQIMKKTGVRYFVTSKIGWNESNTLPYDSFMWQGIDGSEVFTSFIVASRDGTQRQCTYNAQTTPAHVLNTWKRYQQKDYVSEALIPFGYGDGGGGPTRNMLEYQRRTAYGIPGFPKTKISFAGEYLARAKESFDKNAALLGRTPRWVGELYLEYHRGTYTSEAKNKKNNRRSESVLAALESTCVFDWNQNGTAYPKADIDAFWSTVLINQFHDILPGSSIKEVYETTDKEYAALFAKAGDILQQRRCAIAKQIDTAQAGLLVWNTNGFSCSDTVKAGGKSVYVKDIPAFGYAVVKPQTGNGSVTYNGKTLENRFFRLTFNDAFGIVSLYDKRAEREVVKSGSVFNELRLFEDFPRAYDAWEISNYYKQKMWVVDALTSASFVEDGARCGVRIVRDYLRSHIEQTIWLYDDTDRIDVENEVDWHEEHVLLRAFFPVDVHANEATYDIQFGNVKRPTHSNTSWDAAKFEVCAHKWADISEDGYGVALLNDCKYGHGAEGSTLSLTLIKSSTYPNPDADREHHSFRYSIVPHTGDFREADIPHRAVLFNTPLCAEPISAQKGSKPACASLISCENKNIILETVKQSEDGKDIIVRFFENFDRRTKTTLTLGFTAEKAYICDMLEQKETEIPVENNRVCVPTGNYEVVTLRFEK